MELSELIDVNRFAELADLYVRRDTSPEEVLKLPNRSVIFAHDSSVAITSVFPYIRESKNKYVLITARDLPVDEHKLRMAPLNLLKWFANNVACSTKLTQPIPLGLPPLNSAFNRDDGTTGETKRQELFRLCSQEKEISNLVYMNHANHTNPSQRTYLYPMFKDVSWVTSKGGDRRIDYIEYINDIQSHKYMICPPGAGQDCHRVWESLYLGTIPIVESSNAMAYFQELPIIFVEDFKQINPDFLAGETRKIKDNSLRMLRMSYWANMIQEARGSSL